jgi:metal-responsive CopG/Arc/MetJ family transcriptional regulator
MASAVRKITISLPRDLAAEAEYLAKIEGKTISAVIQDALREIRARRLKAEFRAVQGFWSEMAKAKGILTEEDLERYLKE